ncbi:protein mono-ADP-ribosyltransferase PARP4-like isoform X4 [Dysidea avara]
MQDATATMGSTDVWRPLRSLLLLSSGSGADSSTLPPRNVFLVTNGHMTEEQPTLQAIRQAVHTTRVFTFGVRKTANRHFLKSMARVGAGYEEFFHPKTKSKWQRKLSQWLSLLFFFWTSFSWCRTRLALTVLIYATTTTIIVPTRQHGAKLLSLISSTFESVILVCINYLNRMQVLHLCMYMCCYECSNNSMQ